MPEMTVKAPDTTRKVLEYDFTFDAGMVLPVTVDSDAGDTLTETDDRFVLYLSAKPSMGNSDELVPEEEVTVFKKTLATVHKRTRLQRMPTPDELFDMQKLLHSIPMKRM